MLLAILISILLISCSDDSLTNTKTSKPGYDFNGGFETSVNKFNDDDGWIPTILPETKEFTNFVWGADEKHSGNYSVAISIDANHPTDRLIAYNWTKLFKPFEINNEYEVKGWIKTLNLQSSAFIVVQCWNSSNEMVGFFTTQREHPIGGTTDWTEVKTKFTPPENTDNVRIRLGLGAPENSGCEVWFDDINIEAVK